MTGDTRERPAWIALLLTLSFLLCPPVWADSGKELFEKECSGCHTIGGGDSGGPDLKGVAAARSAEWIERLILDPTKLTAEKDPVQLGLVQRYGGEMPNLGLSREDARKIVSYLQSVTAGAPGSGATAQPSEPPPAPVETVVTPELVARGKALFTGETPLASGGAPCSACHGFSLSGVRGGGLAVDLGTRVGAIGERGLRAMLKSPGFPIMRKIYAERPLTDEEINALVALFKDGASRQVPVTGGYFPTAGLVIFACLIAGLALYQRRIR